MNSVQNVTSLTELLNVFGIAVQKQENVRHRPLQQLMCCSKTIEISHVSHMFPFFCHFGLHFLSEHSHVSDVSSFISPKEFYKKHLKKSNC